MRNVNIYFCSGYHNKKSDCKKFNIREDELDEVIEKHRWITKKEISNEEYVNRVEVFNSEEGYIIIYNDHSHDSVMSKNHIRY